MRNLILTLDFDQDTECPSDWDGWKLVSFNRKHYNYQDPSKYQPIPIGLRKKLSVGLAFVLDYHEHGSCIWHLSGEGMICPWDTIQKAGLLIWSSKPKDLGIKSYQDRAISARVFLEAYTDWCNGNCYYFNLEREDGHTIDCCGGFLGSEYMLEEIARKLDHGDRIKVRGQAEWLKSDLELPDGADIVTVFEDLDAKFQPEFSI